MIDVDAMGRTWGASIYRRFTDTSQGFPSTSFIAKVHELHDAAASSTQKLSQFREEAMTGEAKLFARCIDGAPLALKQVAYLHYVERRPIRERAKYAGWSVPEYYRILENLRFWVAGRVVTLQGIEAEQENRLLTAAMR